MDDNHIVIEDLDEISSMPIDELTCLKHLTFGEEFNQSLFNSLDKLTSLQNLTFVKKSINHYPTVLIN